MLDNTQEYASQTLLARLVAGVLPPTNVPEFQWAPIISLALGQGLGPMLLWVIRQGMPLPEFDPFWMPLIKVARQATLHYALLEHTHQRMVTTLAEEGIHAIWLKGIALAHTLYPEPHLRPMADLDVLVPYSLRDNARQVARELGFHASDFNYLGMRDAEDLVGIHDHYIGGVCGSLSVEMHFRLLGQEFDHQKSDEGLAWFWGQTQDLISPGGDWLILKPEAHLLYLCAHAIMRHDEASLDLLHLLDLHLLVVKNRLDWWWVAEQAIRLRWSYAVERGLTLAVGVFDTPVPDWVLGQLRVRRTNEEERTVAKGLRLRARRWEKWKFIFNSLPPARRLCLIWATIFPPQLLLRKYYNLPPSRPVFPYYFHRLWDRGCEVVRSLVDWQSGDA